MAPPLTYKRGCGRFLSCWLRPEQPTVSLAIRAARMMLERRGLVEETDDRTWRRWLEDWSKRSQHIIVLAREGEKAYRDKVAPYISRDDSILEPGQVLIADGHDLNFEILHPATGRPARLKLVMFIDWASRMPVGWQIMPTENSTVIHAALRNALINLGRIPQIVYLDNGKAFKAKVFTETDLDLTELNGLYARLGIATMFAQPYNARAKIIERFFETLNEQFERLMHSYTGASIGDKPAWTHRNEKFHKAQHTRAHRRMDPGHPGSRLARKPIHPVVRPAGTFRESTSKSRRKCLPRGAAQGWTFAS